jgi:DNA-binding IclR family transcriptional regulator
MERDYEIRVVTRAIRVLETLAEADTELGTTEIATTLGISRNAAFRLLYTLEQTHCVEKSPETKKYSLGLRMFELGNSVIKTSDLRDLAVPIVKPLHEMYRETVSLAVMHDGQILYVERLESPRALRTSFTIGSRAYAHSTSLGKAMLAFMAQEEVEAVVSEHGLRQITSHTITSMAQLEEEMEVIRQRGYAVDQEENVDGICCVGAPVFDRFGGPRAAISISAPGARLVDPEYRRKVGGAIVQASHELSRKLGWIPVPSTRV